MTRFTKFASFGECFTLRKKTPSLKYFENGRRTRHAVKALKIRQGHRSDVVKVVKVTAVIGVKIRDIEVVPVLRTYSFYEGG